MVTVDIMPTGLSVSARRMRRVRRTATAGVLAAGMVLVSVAPSTASAVHEPSAFYPAPGQPIATPEPQAGEAASISEKSEQDLRVATLHADLTTDGGSPDAAQQLVSALKSGNHVRARMIARTAQMNDPDVLVLTGVTYDDAEQVAEQLRSLYLAAGQDGLEGLNYPHVLTAPTNSGQQSGADLDGDGMIGGAGDAIGYGDYPGEHGMIVFSKHPIAEDSVRTFQDFLWSDLPGSSMPEGYSALEESVLRLQETSFWDVPVEVPGESEPVHVIATALAADEPTETRAARAEDIRRVIADYVSGSAWYLSDDQGEAGGLGADARAVVAGSPMLSAEKESAQPRPLLDSPQLQDPQPSAVTEEPIAQRPGTEGQTDATATRHIPGERDRRASVVLPSTSFSVSDSGVFWPGEGEYGHAVVDPGSSFSLDDRLVWADLTFGS